MKKKKKKEQWKNPLRQTLPFLARINFIHFKVFAVLSQNFFVNFNFFILITKIHRNKYYVCLIFFTSRHLCFDRFGFCCFSLAQTRHQCLDKQLLFDRPVTDLASSLFACLSRILCFCSQLGWGIKFC